MLVYGQIVIDSYSTPRSIDEKLNNIFTCWVVNRVAVLVLREDLVRDQSFLPLVLELIVRADSKRGDRRAVSHLLLLDFKACHFRCNVRNAFDEML